MVFYGPAHGPYYSLGNNRVQLLEPIISLCKIGSFPTKDEIKSGFACIHRKCPPGYEPNEVLQWIVEGVKDEGDLSTIGKSTW